MAFTNCICNSPESIEGVRTLEMLCNIHNRKTCCLEDFVRLLMLRRRAIDSTAFFCSVPLWGTLSLQGACDYISCPGVLTSACFVGIFFFTSIPLGHFIPK
eukprot:2116540-Amphidinium_carterae.1